MARSKSSRRWLRDHFDDPYVKKAQKEGYRSRAAYKLLEIQEKDRVIKPGSVVVDLGAAPGGWSQIAMGLVGDSGRVVATDILPMDGIPRVEFIQGDFTDQLVFEQLLAVLGGRPVDLVMSDMAPNISGVKVVDQPRAMYLVELALDFALKVLQPNGSLLMKVFQGEGFDPFLAQIRANFARTVIRKPDASRMQSREVYMLASGLRSRQEPGDY